jgi:signal transduction histidine kinase
MSCHRVHNPCQHQPGYSPRTDNGPGIAKDNQSKVFGLCEHFNPDVFGSGIGLAMAKRIIEVHGGKKGGESAGGASG